MAAQYKPYRDDDGSDTLDQEQLNWSDHEPAGSLQIYEKTTYEDIKFLGSNRKTLYVIISVLFIAIFFGFLAGYCIRASQDHVHQVRDDSLMYEDITIKDKILERISNAAIKKLVEEYSQSARIPGSKFDQKLVGHIVENFKGHNLDKVVVKNYSVLLSFPDENNPNYIEVVQTKSDKKRIIFSSLTATNETKDAPFAAFSPSGDVTGDVIFLNYGSEDDYEVLKKWNVSVKGKIVLVKQLHISASEQVHLAQEAGAASLLMYPDPIVQKIPGDAVRRESLLWNGLGDPQTPGYPSTSYAFRIPIDDLKILPTIPVQPISMADALQILVLLSGHRIHDNWLPHSNTSFEYRIGPGFIDPTYQLHLKVNNKLEPKTVQNVIGTIRGRSEPDRYVIIGNHRDSLTSGAIDSAGGAAALLELVSVFSSLVSEGWRPRRSILFCSFGAEEFNLIGSTEWLEENMRAVQSRAVAYISSDILAIGNESISVAASPLLYQAVFNATQQIPFPHLGPSSSFRTIYDKWLATFPAVRNKSQLLFNDYLSQSGKETHLDYESDLDLIKDAAQGKAIEKVQSGSILMNFINSATIRVRPRIRPLDSRSVYSPFVSIAGVPAIEVTFVPGVTESDSLTAFPLIHTQYDNIGLVNTFDKDFKTHAAATKILAEITRDLSDSVFLPFNLLDYCQLLKDLVDALQTHLAPDFAANGVSLVYLESAVHNLTAASLDFHSRQDNLKNNNILEIRRMNDLLLQFERTFLDNNGLPRNPNKKHLVLSPSDDESHSSEMFPGLLDEFLLLAKTEYDNTRWSWEIIKAHYSILCHTIQGAADLMNEL